MIGKNEQLNQAGSTPLPPKSKVCIHIELGCESQYLEENLRKLHGLLEKTRKDTNEFYENTRVPLMELLTTAVGKIEGKEDKGSIQIKNLNPFDGWGCTITLATLEQPHLTSD
jgi:hypothetical protein